MNGAASGADACLLPLRRSKKYNKAPTTAATATPPIAIPAIAPVPTDVLFDVLVSAAAVLEELDVGVTVTVCPDAVMVCNVVCAVDELDDVDIAAGAAAATDAHLFDVNEIGVFESPQLEDKMT
jgi:hypothetical protein